MYKILNTLGLFWFTIDSSVPISEGIQFFFHAICHFLGFLCSLYQIIQKDYIKGPLNISAHLSMKMILVNLSSVRTSFGNIFLILIMVRTIDNNHFLMHIKLGYLRYIIVLMAKMFRDFSKERMLETGSGCCIVTYNR